MIDLNQEVVVKWNNYTKKYYESLGYQFTNIGDAFMIKAFELQNNSAVEVKVVCDECGKTFDRKYKDYNKIISNNNGKYICKSCTTKIRNKKENPKEKFFNVFLEFCKRNNYEPISTIDDYENAKSKLYYVCPFHGEKHITYDSITDTNVGCRECSYKVIGAKQMLPISKVKKIVEGNGNTLLNPNDYINMNEKNLLIKCGICNKTFTTSLSSQVNSNGSCIECSHIKTAEHLTLSSEYLDDLYNSESIVLLNSNEYIANNVINLKFVCRECGEVFIASKANFDAGQTRCNKCARSKSDGEEIIESFLNSHYIRNIFQYRFDNCRDIKPLPFDFYLPDLNICIEFDGPHHFFPVFGEDRFEKTQCHDEIKTKYCIDNNIKLIRIPYWDGHIIEELLIKELQLK